ncbi:MFS general substrate transporter [Massarina eburnea CBS 473.64]|uniref:MFS general substrate transporter n=1 Tax=Massarina eburnea CBS 473.64 TaxID=1395130 RepID=A0A6A6RG21_9PLEO|nr:MFS general substrate transporter [Massarina eburnea CBS 473.64]
MIPHFSFDHFHRNQLSRRPTVESVAFLSGLPLASVVIGLATAIFVMGLDSSIIATAIPRITTQFNSTGDIGWYGSAYSFSFCVLQPIFGKLFSIFSMKGTFLGCIAFFEIGSLICATAINSPMLIIGRAIAGIGAAGCFTGAFCILATAMPMGKRPIYIGILTATAGFSAIIGPVLGGVFTEYATWRWCFWINLPLGAISIFTLVFFLPSPSRKETKPESVFHRLAKLDLIGAGLFIPAIIMILLGLQWGGTKYVWKSAAIIGLFIGGTVLLLIFVAWQVRRGDDAMIPLGLISQRTLALACIFEFFIMGAIFISVYFLPEWFQVIKSALPKQSGVMYLPLAISDILASLLAGASLQMLRYPNVYLLLGPALISIAAGLFTTLSTTTNHQHWIPYQVLQGLGAGMSLVMPYTATQMVLKPKDVPVGTSLIQCMQYFGASVWLAVSQSIFQNRLVQHLTSVGVGQEDIREILKAGSGGIRSAVPTALLEDVVDAYNYGITGTFYVAASGAIIAFLCSLGMPWNSITAKDQSLSDKSEDQA